MNTGKFYWMPKPGATAISLDMDEASGNGRQ